MKEYNNSSFFALVRDFLTKYLPDECACSANTITSYQKTLNLYFSYVCGVRKIKIYQFQPSFVTRNSVADFLNHVETVRGCSVSTRNQRLSAIRSFLKYAAEQDSEYVATYIEISLIPTKKKEIVTDISFFSEEALAAILAVPNPHKPTEARDLLFMVVLYDTGARIQELLDLHLGDIRISKRERYVMVTGKGGKRRNIPLMEKQQSMYRSTSSSFKLLGRVMISSFTRSEGVAARKCLKTTLQNLLSDTQKSQGKNVLMYPKIYILICLDTQGLCTFIEAECLYRWFLNGLAMHNLRRPFGFMQMQI